MIRLLGVKNSLIWHTVFIGYILISIFGVGWFFYYYNNLIAPLFALSVVLVLGFATISYILDYVDYNPTKKTLIFFTRFRKRKLLLEEIESWGLFTNSNVEPASLMIFRHFTAKLKNNQVFTVRIPHDRDKKKIFEIFENLIGKPGKDFGSKKLSHNDLVNDFKD